MLKNTQQRVETILDDRLDLAIKIIEERGSNIKRDRMGCILKPKERVST